MEIEIAVRRVQIVHYDTSAGSSISGTPGKKRVLKIELSTHCIKEFCTIHVRERDSRLVCLSTLASLGCKRHTSRKSTFLPSGRKALTSRLLRETKLPLSGAVEQKNSIRTLACKKESLRSRVCQPRLRLGRQVHVIWDISYFTGHGS